MIDRKRLLFVSISCLVTAVATGSILLNWQSSQSTLEIVMLVALGLTCALPAIVALLRKRLDIFEPVYAFAFATFIYMVLMPIVLLRSGDTYLGGVNYRSDMPIAIGLALLALVGFYLGYHGAPASTRSKRIHWPPIDPINRRWAALISAILFVFFLGLVFLWIIIARVPLNSLWILGSGSAYGDAFALATGPSIGYLYGAREALPTCLLLLLATRSKGRLSLLIIVMLIVLTLPLTVGDGARFRALILALGLFAYIYLERGTRPRTSTLVVFILIVFFVIVAGIGFYRSSTYDSGSVRDRAISEDVISPTDAWETFVDGSNIVVAAAAIIHLVPTYVNHLYGLTFLDFFIQPIPRILWPGKPQSLGLEELSNVWPRGTAAPFWTMFYINFNFVGVLVGMALWGWLSRRIYDIYLQNPNNRLAQVQLAIYLPFVVHAYGRSEASFAFNAYAFIYLMLPVWILSWLLKRRVARSRRLPSLAPLKSS